MGGQYHTRIIPYHEWAAAVLVSCSYHTVSCRIMPDAERDSYHDGIGWYRSVSWDASLRWYLVFSVRVSCRRIITYHVVSVMCPWPSLIRYDTAWYNLIRLDTKSWYGSQRILSSWGLWCPYLAVSALRTVSCPYHVSRKVRRIMSWYVLIRSWYALIRSDTHDTGVQTK